MRGPKPQRRVPDERERPPAETADQRRERQLRELRELHWIELGQAYAEGKRDGIAEERAAQSRKATG